MEMEMHKMNSVLLEWNRCHGAFYQLRNADLQWNLRAQSFVAYSEATCAGVPILGAVATDLGVAHGIPSKSFWLSLFGKIPHGKENEFVISLLELAKSKGKTRVAIGADDFHFLPGLPEEFEDHLPLKQALLQNGFQGTEAVDFVGSVRTKPVEDAIKAALSHAKKEGMFFEVARDEQMYTELDHFLQKEFSGRWHREFIFWKNRSDTKRASWALLKKDNEVIGFARYAIRGAEDATTHWTPGALRFPLSADLPVSWKETDACLGPIGMALSQRGKGVGKTLLGLTLNNILQNNANLLCIDWTNAYNYYMPLGFEVGRKYWSSWKSS